VGRTIGGAGHCWGGGGECAMSVLLVIRDAEDDDTVVLAENFLRGTLS
jgi:hypothetical protein